MLRLEVGLRVLVDLVLLAEVDLVNWLLSKSLEGILEVAYLIMLVHCIAWHHVLVEISAELVVGVHVHLFLQLTPDIFVLVVRAQFLVQFVVVRGGLVFHGAILDLFILSLVLFIKVLRMFLFSVVVELKKQIMLLSSCQHFD